MPVKKAGSVSPETLVRFGAALRKAREAAGMTLEDVAKLSPKKTIAGRETFMHIGEVSRIERGLKPNVTFTVLQRLAAAVGLDVSLHLIEPPPKTRRIKKS